MQILFLDIDGVLNSARSRLVSSELDPISVGLINKLCNKHDLGLVIASAHRQSFLNPRAFYGDQESMVRSTVDLIGLEQYMRLLGIKGPILDATPSIDGISSTRGHEIQFWLDNNEWDNYAIIDDDPNMLPGHNDRFVLTDFNDGITFDGFMKLDGLLSKGAL